MKSILSIAFSLIFVFALTACQKAGSTVLSFPAYKEDNLDNLPYIDAINDAAGFQVTADFPKNWSVRNTKPDLAALVPGDFYTPLYIYEGDTLIGYIGFNIFEPYTEEIPPEQYYQTVYPTLRLPYFFHWEPYVSVTTTDAGETQVADIWYLDPEEIDNHPGAMPDVPQIETIGILSYDKELKVYIGIAFMPDTVGRAQAEAIAQSIRLSPVQ